MAKKKNEVEDPPEEEAGTSDVQRKKKKKKKEEPIEESNAGNKGDDSPPPPTPPPENEKKAANIMTTREIGRRYLDRETYLKLCLREMLIYIVFLVIVGVLASGQHVSSEYYLSRVMTKLFVETKFRTMKTKEIISYNDINTLEHVWEYFDYYTRNVEWDFWYSHLDKSEAQPPTENLILHENKLMGKPRIRQLRVRGDSCTVPDDFKLMFANCYAEFSSSSESIDNYGYKNTTAWKYHKPDKLCGTSTSGEISTYFGGGFYLDLDKDAFSTNRANLQELWRGLWLDRGSRALIMQFTTYNANANLFFTLKLLLELPPTGGVLPSYIIYVEKFLMRDIWDYVLLVCMAIFVIYVIVYTVLEIYEMIYFKWHYLDHFWNFCDLVILILCYFAIGFFIYSFLVIQSELPKLIKTTEEHACFDTINNARENFITFMAILFFFAGIKLLKYMNFNHSMFQMQMTLSKATKDIACFSIIFFIVFITFAQLGHLLFGSQVRDFRSFVHSVFALLRTAVGDFDYHKIENVNHFLGPVYFFAYIFFIYFILVNMFLAIIIDTYSEVRTSIRDQAKELQISDMVCGWFLNLMKKCGCRKIAEKHAQPMPVGEGATADEDIHKLLTRCGFTETEIDLFFVKFDIPRDRQVSQEEMRNKLLTNFTVQQETGKKVTPEAQERDEVGEKLMSRIRVLEDNITDVNYKIDLIDNKIDAIQQIRARRRTMAKEGKEDK